MAPLLHAVPHKFNNLTPVTSRRSGASRPLSKPYWSENHMTKRLESIIMLLIFFAPPKDVSVLLSLSTSALRRLFWIKRKASQVAKCHARTTWQPTHCWWIHWWEERLLTEVRAIPLTVECICKRLQNMVAPWWVVLALLVLLSPNGMICNRLGCISAVTSTHITCRSGTLGSQALKLTEAHNLLPSLCTRARFQPVM